MKEYNRTKAKRDELRGIAESLMAISVGREEKIREREENEREQKELKASRLYTQISNMAYGRCWFFEAWLDITYQRLRGQFTPEFVLSKLDSLIIYGLSREEIKRKIGEN